MFVRCLLSDTRHIMDNLGFSSVGGILNAVFTELQNQGPLQAGAGAGAVL